MTIEEGLIIVVVTTIVGCWLASYVYDKVVR
jgi:hypothetical protein